MLVALVATVCLAPGAWADEAFYLKASDGQYLGIDGNLWLVDGTAKKLCTFTGSDGAYTVAIAGGQSIHIGSSKWSDGSATSITAYHYSDGVATKASTLTADEQYIFVGDRSGTKYTMRGVTNGSTGNDQRLEWQQVTVSGNTCTGFEASDVWTLEGVPEDPRTNLEGINLKNAAGDYLAFTADHNISVSTTPYVYNIRKVDHVDSAWKVWSEDNYQFNSGSNGFFSPAPSNNSTSLNFYFYEASVSGSTLTASLVDQPEAGKSYLFVADKLGSYYAAYGEMASRKTTSARLDVVAVPGSKLPTSITINAGDATSDGGTVDLQKVVWTIVDPNAKEPLTYLRLQFSETTANSTTVSVVDKAGNAIEGASAELVGVQKKDGSSDPVTCTLQTQNGHLLTPQYTNAPGNGWILTFRLNGVTTGKFNKAAADLHAMNAQGGYQNDANIKYWTANLSTGTSEEAMTDFGTSARYGISDPQYQDGSTRHVEVAIPGGNTVEYADGMLVKLYVMKVEGGGCFAGVKYLDLLYVTPREELANVLAEAGTHNVGESLGQYNAEGFAEAYASASAVSENQEASDEDVAAAASQLATAISNLTLNMPKVGQFFRIKASADHIGTPTYLTGEQNENNRIKFTQDAEEIAGANTIFCYFHTNGNYLACYGNGMTAANKSNFLGVAQYPSTTAIAFEPATTGKKTGKYNIKFAGSRYLYTNTGLYADAGSGSTAEGYNYELIEVTELPVAFHKDGQGYATLYSPAALQIPEGVEAYTLHAGTADSHLLAEQVSEVIPAGTAVVLKGTADTTKSFAVSKEEGTADELNVLTGTVPALAAGEGKYVFSVVGEEAGFYKFAGSNLAGFKAYYVPQASENVQGFVINFGGEQTTGIISATENANANGTCFDLQGRRVNAGVKGISIVNNKKVIK